MTRTWGEQWRAIEVLSLASFAVPWLRAAVCGGTSKGAYDWNFPSCLAQADYLAQGSVHRDGPQRVAPATVHRDDWSRLPKAAHPVRIQTISSDKQWRIPLVPIPWVAALVTR